MESVLSKGTKQLQMVREALMVSDFDEKSKINLKVYAAREKNGQKMVMQVLDHKTRDIGL